MGDFTRSTALITAAGAIIAAAVGGYVARGGDPVVVQLPNQTEQTLRPDEAGKRIESLATRLAKAEQALASSKEEVDKLNREVASHRKRAGIPSPQSGATSDSPPTLAEPQRLSGNGFDFILQGCRVGRSETVCHLKIKNGREDRKMLLLARSSRWGTSSFLYDDAGTSHSALQAQLGKSGGPISNLITGIEYDANFSFQGILESAAQLPVLDIGYVVYHPSGVSVGGIQRVKYREVAILP